MCILKSYSMCIFMLFYNILGNVVGASFSSGFNESIPYHTILTLLHTWSRWWSVVALEKIFVPLTRQRHNVAA